MCQPHTKISKKSNAHEHKELDNRQLDFLEVSNSCHYHLVHGGAPPKGWDPLNHKGSISTRTIHSPFQIGGSQTKHTPKSLPTINFTRKVTSLQLGSVGASKPQWWGGSDGIPYSPLLCCSTDTLPTTEEQLHNCPMHLRGVSWSPTRCRCEAAVTDILGYYLEVVIVSLP